MRLPRMYRKKRGDKLVGSWRVMIAGDEVNLGTTDAELARERLRAALQRGRRNFDDELTEAAELEDVNDLPAAPGPTGQAPPQPTQVAEPPASTAPPPPSTAPLPELPPPAQDAGDAEDMAAAAAEVAAGAPANDNAAAAALPISNDVLDAMLEQGASVIVDLQLSLQAYAIKRGTGLVAGAIPTDSTLRTGAAKAWVQQLKVWFPSTTMLPPWAVAIILPAMALPQQLATARPPTKDELEAEKKSQEDQSSEPQAAVQ